MRLKIKSDDFKPIADATISAFESWVSNDAGDRWQVESPNYEGVRVKVLDDSGKDTGWALLRASLHDPLIVINAESDVKGGAHLTDGGLCIICAARKLHSTSGMSVRIQQHVALQHSHVAAAPQTQHMYRMAYQLMMQLQALATSFAGYASSWQMHRYRPVTRKVAPV